MCECVNQRQNKIRIRSKSVMMETETWTGLSKCGSLRGGEIALEITLFCFSNLRIYNALRFIFTEKSLFNTSGVCVS